MNEHSESVYYIHVDSKNRDCNIYPFGNSYTLHFVKDLKNVTRVDLVSAKVPNSIYNLTNGTDVMNDISIPPGFYCAQNLATDISKRIGKDSFQYLPSEGRFIYLSNDPASTITVHSSEFAKMSGFINEKTYDVSPISFIPGFTHGVKSENLIDLSLNEYVFLDIEEFRTPYFEDLKSLSMSGMNARNMFAAIPMDVSSTQVKTFKESTDYYVSMQVPRQTLSRLTIRWFDKNLNLLNFQGFENNAFILRVHCDQIVNVVQHEDEERETVDKYIKEIKKRLDEEKQKEELKKKKQITIGKWVLVASVAMILLYWYVSKDMSIVSRY